MSIGNRHSSPPLQSNAQPRVLLTRLVVVSDPASSEAVLALGLDSAAASVEGVALHTVLQKLQSVLPAVAAISDLNGLLALPAAAAPSSAMPLIADSLVDTAFCRAMPKLELHAHLHGSLRQVRSWLGFIVVLVVVLFVVENAECYVTAVLPPKILICRLKPIIFLLAVILSDYSLR
jgi:hypothetical protein